MANQIGDTVSKGNYFNVCTDETKQTFETKSFYTDSGDVSFADGENAENKVGAIKGITSDLNTTTTGYAADMTTVSKLNSSLVSDIYVGDDGNLHKVVGGADTVIPFKKLTLADEIDYSNYEYTTNGLDPEVYNKVNSKGATLISGGYCIDGDLVHVDIVWQQQGDYVSYVARILGFPIPNKEIPIDSVVQIDQTYSYKYGGKLFTDGSLGMNASNVYARKVHWQFTYRRQSS